MQDRTQVGLSEKLEAFKGKLSLWKQQMADGKIATLPVLSLLLENEAASVVNIQNIIVEHLAKLIEECDHYIPDNVSKYSFVPNPFNVNVADLPEKMWRIYQLQEQLIEVQNDETLYYDLKTQNKSLSAFWVKVNKEKPVLGGEAF